ncbi:hypothetical protein, partial [Streptomyces sp. NPDC057686]
VAAAVTGPNGLRWWKGYEPTWADTYGPGLWAALRPALRLEEDAPIQAWMVLPHDADAPDAAIVLRLPTPLLGTPADRTALHQILHACVPGTWVCRWQTIGTERHIRWWQEDNPAGGNPGSPLTPDQEFGPGLWAALRTLLSVPVWEPREDWLTVAGDPSGPDAEISLRLPTGWLGEPQQLSYVVGLRMPGEWTISTNLTGFGNSVSWRRKPAPIQRPELPEKVSWKSTGDPRSLYFGETHDGPALVQTGTATPHIGVSGETGSGKSTLLYIAVAVARQAGELVTIIDPKQNSMAEADGKSGVRIHTETYECVWAIAEFFTSMMATETRKRKGWKPNPGDVDATPVGRLLVIDELPSFREFVAAWWKYIIKERGFPPVLVWFQMILMQGRSSDHRVAVGTHQFSLDVFGSTMARDQVGTKMVVGETSDPSWAVAYGATTPRFEYDETIPGRGVISTKGRKKKKIGADGRPERVEEIQFAYITPEIGRILDACPKAPAWFDNGEMAPWITAQDIARADSAAAVAEFLTGDYSAPPAALTQDTDTDDTATGVPRPRSERVSDTSDGADASAAGGAGAPSMADLVERLAQEDEPIVERWTLAQACQIGIVDKTYGAAREAKSQMARRGIAFPAGEKRGRTTWYTREELESVFGAPAEETEAA